MTLIILLCYYYTGHDEKTYDSHSISSPQPNKTERGHLATQVSFSLHNVEKWDIMKASLYCKRGTMNNEI